MGQEAQSRDGTPNLLETGGHGGTDVPDEWGEGNQGVTALFHFDQDGGADAQGDGGEKLIGNSEQRPKTIDSAQGIQHTLEQKVSPERDDQRACQKNARIPTHLAQWLPELPEQILQHKAPDASAGVENGENEKSLEHDGEVIPNAHHRGAAKRAGKDMGHADRQRWSAAGTVEKSHLADSGRQVGHILSRDREAPTRNGSHRLLRQGADYTRGAIHGKVNARLENAGGDHGHHGHEAFHEHAAVTNQPSLAFLTEHFRSCARGDERVKPG